MITIVTQNYFTIYIYFILNFSFSEKLFEDDGFVFPMNMSYKVEKEVLQI